MISVAWGLTQWIVVAVALQRLLELVLAKRNTARLLAEGGVEIGRGHYPPIVLLHSGWLVVLFVRTPADAAVNLWLIVFFVLLQAGRVWVIASLGRYWTTRIITVQDAPLIDRGPYRWLNHPNYVIVALELAVLPLAFGDWLVALAFTVANGALMYMRIPAENRALESRHSK